MRTIYFHGRFDILLIERYYDYDHHIGDHKRASLDKILIGIEQAIWIDTKISIGYN